MIHVTINRKFPDRHIGSVRITGHAEYAESGKDLVCAAVSAISTGTVNAVEHLLGVNVQCETHKGFMHIIVPGALAGVQQERVQLLLESMRVMLQTIEQSYGQFIQITDK